jgi:hypothetical protein
MRVNPRTLYRWMKEPEFDAAYRKAKRAAFSQSIARLHQITSSDGCLLLSPVFRSMSLHRGAPGGHLGGICARSARLMQF